MLVNLKDTGSFNVDIYQGHLIMWNITEQSTIHCRSDSSVV